MTDVPLRYASNGTDAEWALAAPFMPKRSKVGRPRRTRMRAVWNAIRYILATGCQWAQLPKDFPVFTTVQSYFYTLRGMSGRCGLINEALASASRLLSGRAAGRAAGQAAGVIDSPSVKTTESGGPRGYDAGRTVKGRKRHMLTDTDGNLLAAGVHTAKIQDRDGAVGVIGDAQDSFPTLAHIFADGGYAGDTLEVEMIRADGPTIEIVRRPNDAKGFVVIVKQTEKTNAF